LSRSASSSACRRQGGKANGGFTLIEVLVALAVIAVSLGAIGSLIAASVRGTRALERQVALVETARSVIAGLPDRESFVPGGFAGVTAGHRWRVDVLPFRTGTDPKEPTPWLPQTVVVRVQSPSGPILQVESVRLRRRPPE
jgi:general secretion pathway protein I